MEVIMSDAVRKMLDDHHIFQIRTGMSHRREGIKYRWKNGDKVFYNVGCSIEPFSTFDRGNSLYTCGAFSAIASGLRPNTVVGRYVEMGTGCSMMGFRHPVESVSINSAVFNFARENIAPYFEQYEENNGRVTKRGVPIPQPQEQPLIIGNDVWVGNNCTFRGGITIHTGAVIASNSVVLKDVPPYAVVAGVPAKIKKFRFPPEIIHGLLESRWWDYELGDMYRENLDFRSPEVFLQRFSIVKGNLRKFNPKPFVPIVEFNNVKFREQHGSIITYWGTLLNVNTEGRLVHSDKLESQVKKSGADEFVYRRTGSDIVLTGANTGVLDKNAHFKVVNNVDASISIKVGDWYLSARPGGEISLVEENRDWEHFYVIR